jgi:hypothetical protein
MTRVRLPPDPENSCITTIVDSQGGDAALTSAVATMSISGGAAGGSTSASLSNLQKSLSNSTSSNVGGIENVDSIILIYDLDRDETFFRLENHWLPLIERCYNGGVSSRVLHLREATMYLAGFLYISIIAISLLFLFCSFFGTSCQSLLPEIRWIYSSHLAQQVSRTNKSWRDLDNRL